MKKLLLSISLILIPLLAIADSTGSCGDGVTFKYSGSTHTLTIKGEGAIRDCSPGESSLSDYRCPWYYYRSEIQKVIIEEGVTKIGEYAFFRCNNISSVSLPNSITIIRRSAFDGCSSLTSIVIPNSVTTIKERAFNECSSVTSIRIPNSVTTIEPWAFSCCTSLTSAEIPNSITRLQGRTFYGCTSLTSVNLPNSLVDIGSGMFEFCSSLTSITFPYGLQDIGEYTFHGCSNLTSIYIPNSVRSIGPYAFYDCSSLTSIDIPNSVRSIGTNAFNGCSNLTSITVPNSVTHIYPSAFAGTAWYNNQPDGMVYVGKVAYKYKGTIPTSIKFEEGTLGIAEDAFHSCQDLTSITIPNSMTYIGSDAFWGCSSLKSIYSMIENIFDIGQDVFDKETLNNATLYVPIGKKEEYQQAKGWNKFINTKEYDYSLGINNSFQEKNIKVVDSYQLDGKKVDSSHHGLNIIRMSDGSRKKIMK